MRRWMATPESECRVMPRSPGPSCTGQIPHNPGISRRVLFRDPLRNPRFPSSLDIGRFVTPDCMSRYWSFHASDCEGPERKVDFARRRTIERAACDLVANDSYSKQTRLIYS